MLPADTPPNFQPDAFDIAPYAKRVAKPWGYEIHWVKDDLPYMGKLLHIDAGKRLSLQMHDKKQESWLLIAGRCAVICEDSTGLLVETELEAGMGYTIQIGQKHRLKGITDCDIIEVSTPEAGTTWRLEDDYARFAQTPEGRAAEYAQNAHIITDI